MRPQAEHWSPRSEARGRTRPMGLDLEALAFCRKAEGTPILPRTTLAVQRTGHAGPSRTGCFVRNGDSGLRRRCHRSSRIVRTADIHCCARNRSLRRQRRHHPSQRTCHCLCRGGLQRRQRRQRSTALHRRASSGSGFSGHRGHAWSTHLVLCRLFRGAA